ncbi:hypothetical protein PFICI_14170 [Pestalotiopsis fici W106-1]|uniref:DUF7820 domain-containing protein n=1 Tax=Pestalotiopsis fici (strain W106-1 / CGMCC3.15140) TaxID=1229662 RepID=W3WKP6_PESFW|nr:uncharacterized protein PFICI_14170 [Pestalotiopsis fici W106-1]ETS74304.1 hypothetical protein PFICI_14170 [Pestalotiopsis fici W106-1]
MNGGSDNKMPIERRASMRTSMRLSISPGEDDDYDMQMMGISDGFRPTNMTQPPQQPLPNPPIPLQPTPSTKSVQKPRPSSIAKPPQPRESFSLRHDGGMGSLADSVVAGSSSNVAQTVARAESPYQGPSGPSFPYQMYTQDVRPQRTNSLATTVTVPATERSYNGPNNPTHPYQMYPQNTAAASDVPEGRASPVIPVGFTGAVDNYQRRLGPEGEEAGDMIGPDGHTEQLPPYTRYPDEAYQRKIAGIGGMPAMEPSAGASSASQAALAVGSASVPTSAATSVSSPSPRSSAGTTALQAIPGAGGLGLATRNPEFASTDDLSLQAGHSPQSRQSLRSFTSEGDNPQINTAAQTVLSEKKPAKKWQIIARRKVWGVVPCWALTITLIIIVMLAIVLGTVLGIFFNKPKKPPPPSDSSSATMTYDASPLSTVPADLAALPSGEFALPLMLTRSPTTCFNDSTQAQAWNCNQVFAQLSLHIDKLSETPSTSQYSMSLHYNESFTIESDEYSYGMQPPKVNDVTMLLVTDVNEPTRGPAWAFEVAYNKTVIIPEGLFPGSSSSSSSKRGSPPPPPPGGGGGGFPGGDFKRKGLAQSGDKPWICSWDGTILEVFVYPNQNNSQPSLVFPDSGPSFTGGTTTATVTSTASSSTATSISTDDDDSESADYRNQYTSHHRRQASASPSATTTTSTSATSTISSSGVFDTSVPSPSDFQVPFFPRVVKMEERRLAGSPSVQPYCRQYQINSNGPATPLTDSNGHPIEVKIVEIEPDEDESSHERKSSRRERLVQRKVIDDYLNNGVKPRDSDSDMSNCGCMWWAT